MYSAWIVILFTVFVTLCHGNSFNNITLLRETRETTRGCTLPKHPEFGQWSIYDSPEQLYPGDWVPLRTVLQISCRQKYTIDGESVIVCVDGKWTSQIGRCLLTCPSILSSPVMTVTCTYNNRKLKDCTNAIDQTKAKFKCADFYEDESLHRHSVHVCYNGRWSNRLPECVPICGQKFGTDRTLIVGGNNATEGEYPWHVALYKNDDKKFACGGSLINPRLILTAAHCVADDDGHLLPTDTYLAAVGKYYRKYYDTRDFVHAQFSPIRKIFIPPQYQGAIQHFYGDIAILVTKKTFQLSLRVQPVCVHWEPKLYQLLLDSSRNQNFYVTGWGNTVEDKNLSSVLKELKLPLISDETCRQKLSEEDKKYLTYDKLCAGFLNAGMSACKGDSGGGLVALYKNKYYIMGVVSISPLADTPHGGCNSQHYTLFTRVSDYIDNFIVEKEAQFRSTVGDEVACEDDPDCIEESTPSTTTTVSVLPDLSGKCQLPEHPLSGKLAIFGATSLPSPSVLVSPGTILTVSCDEGFYLSGTNITVCQNGQWQTEIGQCLKTCPPVHSSESTKLTCFFKDQEIDCSKPYDGVIVKHTCSDFYEHLELAKNPVRVCKNGNWNNAVLECVPVCGQRSVTPQTLIVNGVTAERNEYPWQVAVYREKDKLLICGGALISQRLILTVAHCVSNDSGDALPKDDYIVAVGKYHRKYNVIDSDQQLAKLQDIFLPPQYKADIQNYFGDIAILVSKTSFKLSRSVQPVCLNYEPNNVIPENDTNIDIFGYITGWGFTLPHRNPAQKLQSLKVPIIPSTKCLEELPKDYKKYKTYDKFCGGYLDKNTSSCKGDSGSALVTKYKGRYYATGILSIQPPEPTTGGCNINQYSLYTKVSSYNDFILEKEAPFKIKRSTDSDCIGGFCGTTTRPSSVSPPTRAGCVLPQIPAFGKWEVYTTSQKYFPGDLVPAGTILRLSCYSKYKLDGDSVVLCENGEWSSQISACLKTCPSVYTTPHLKVTCLNRWKNCTEPVDGTNVKYECAPFYEAEELRNSPVHTCQDGKWSHPQPHCLPVCGRKSLAPPILIINGKPVKKESYPWHVGIYKRSDNNFICSGSLISERLILTSADCVTFQNATIPPVSSFQVIAGKYYRRQPDLREDTSKVQYAELEDIFILSRLRRRSSNANIAILLTTKPFTLSSTVQPVCVDLELKYEIEFIKSNRNLTGYITGWGYTTETGEPADELQELQVPIINDVKCQQELPEEISNSLTHDRFCAGYKNMGSKSVCQGDNGGGLVTKFDGRYFIVGIVDIGSLNSPRGCDNQQYTLYTKIYSYINNFIADKMKMYKA